MTVMDDVLDKKLVVVQSTIISYEKASRVFEEKELDKHSAVRSCQAVVVKGSGVDEWPCMKLVWVFKYILVHVYIVMPIKLFFCTKGRGRGGVRANSSGIRI